jgi:hypothetical protein
MKTNWKALGIAAVSAALLYYPALKLYQYITKKEAEGYEDGKEDKIDHHAMKTFSPAYRGKYKPHHRHTHDGLDGHDHV